MAFVSSVFPNPKLIHDLERDISAQTTVVGNGNKEYRIQKELNYRLRWRWPSRALSAISSQEIARFIAVTARFEQNSFLFKDPYNHSWSDVQLNFTGVGTKYYLTVSNLDLHPISHIDTAVVKVNGSPVSFTQGTLNGKSIIEVPSNGTVTITGEYYYSARVESASFTQIMSALSTTNAPLVDTIGDINLVEVFE